MININKNTLYISIVFLLNMFLSDRIFAYDMKNIIAYPVPFNPGLHKIINIGNNPNIGSPQSPDKVKVEIYDINGDPVFTGNYSVLPVIWNGRNSKGKIVRPGLYIIKITFEDNTTGDYGKKLIRILVTG